MSDDHGDLLARLARRLRAAERRNPGTVRAVLQELHEQEHADAPEQLAQAETPEAAMAEAQRLLDAHDRAERGAR